MFFGEFEHALDDKGRVILPAKFRDRFADGAYLTKVLDGCLAVYTPEEFELVAREVQEKARRGGVARNVARTFAAGTTEVVPDRQGRVAIPQTLRSFAGLTDRVMVTGQFNRLEIWDAERWTEVNRQGEASMSDPHADIDDMTF
jgi:MraZ protein